MSPLKYAIHLMVNWLSYQVTKNERRLCFKPKCFRQTLGVLTRNAESCTNRAKLLIAYFATEILIIIGLALKFALANFVFESKFALFGVRILQYVFGKLDIDPIKEVLWPYCNSRLTQFAFPSQLFPIITKCSFKYYGTSGSIQRYNSLCVLNFNYLNQFMYTFFWFWYVVMAGLFAVILLLKLFILICPMVRIVRCKHYMTKVHQSDMEEDSVQTIESVVSVHHFLILRNVSTVN